MKTAKGINASDYLNFDTALNTGIKLLNDDKKQKIGQVWSVKKKESV